MIANQRLAFVGSPAAMEASDDPLVQQFLSGGGMVRWHFITPDPGFRIRFDDGLGRSVRAR